MKFFLALFALIAVAQCRSSGEWTKFNLNKNVTDIIRDYDYPVQNYTVQTSDGYLLDLIRVPCGQNQCQGRNVQSNNKPVVLLMHGLLSSCEDFVIGGPTEGLAFYLADQGYDVFLGNARGSQYARKHTSLNPSKDAAFWKFCWETIAKKDLAAIIDEILRISGQSKLNYIGHMQGATVFYVLASEVPEYNNKIEKMVALGPWAYFKGASNEMFQTIVDHASSKAWLLKNLGVNEFHPSNELMSIAGQDSCIARGINERICQNAYFLINGYESGKLNTTTAQRYAQRLPAGASSRQVLHFAQIYKSGRFEKYSNEYKPDQQQQEQQQQWQQEQQPEEFSIENVSSPVYLVYAGQDKLTTKESVQYLKNKLPHVVRDVEIVQAENNLDLIFGKNVRNVYDTVHTFLQH